MAAVLLLVFALVKLGPVEMVLFFTFLSWAVQDAMHGKVLALSFLPGILLAVYYWDAATEIFIPVFVALAFLWCVISLVKTRRLGARPGIAYGLGDVMAVPFAVTLSHVLVPFWGLAVFGAAMAATLPFMLRKKTVRLISWISPGVVACFMAALIL